MAESVVVLEPGEERAQKIAKAMSSQTAGDILRLIGDGQKTSTEISEQLALPMNTAKYHIENLLDAGLISVASTKYSIKGREVKVYTLTNQLLIVAPRPSNVRSLLLKYASLFGIVVFGSFVIAALSPLFRTATAFNDLDMATGMSARTAGEGGSVLTKAVSDEIAANGTAAPDAVLFGAQEASEIAAGNLTPEPTVMAAMQMAAQDTAASAVAMTPDAALAFFLGGTCVILVLVCYEIYIWRRMKKQ